MSMVNRRVALTHMNWVKEFMTFVSTAEVKDLMRLMFV